MNADDADALLRVRVHLIQMSVDHVAAATIAVHDDAVEAVECIGVLRPAVRKDGRIKTGHRSFERPRQQDVAGLVLVSPVSVTASPGNKSDPLVPRRLFVRYRRETRESVAAFARTRDSSNFRLSR